MEMIKGVILDRGEKELDIIPVHTYLVSFMLVTDKPLNNLSSTGETIIMGVNQFSNVMTDAVKQAQTYEPPHKLGDVTNAVLDVMVMDPNDLDRVK
jgi:hypothetical protein